jgi:collagenase-like PrtC family protease
MLDEVTRLGVDLLRISPQSQHTAEVIQVFAACLAGRLDIPTGVSRLRDWSPSGLCDGYWTGRAGIASTPLARAT